MTQVVHQHGDVIPSLRLDNAPQPERLEGGTHPRQQLARIDGLRQVGVGSLLQPRLDGVRLPAGGCEHDDRRPPTPAGPKLSQHLHPVHPGHRDVEKHELRLARIDDPERLEAALGDAHTVAVFRENVVVERERVREVIHDEDVPRSVVQRRERGPLGRRHETASVSDEGGALGGEASLVGAARRGSTSVKVDPSPWRDRTSMSPPSARASLRDSARPTPVPS